MRAASARIVVDPVTRIEGHLRIEAEVKDGRIVDAWSAGTMVRGLEIILKGRDPRDAWAFCERVCGVCTTVHALASVRAVEEVVALGGDGAPAARAKRPRAGTRHAGLDDLAQRLSDRFDTRVQIALGRRKGKLSVEFASVEDLNRIVALLAPGDEAFGGGQQR